ncbi:MAG: hypothetical protein O2973_11685, partial [Gemmatimonadetes bacterium]|nr:hypothetical protein [Gemmatimonadota bacterium]
MAGTDLEVPLASDTPSHLPGVVRPVKDRLSLTRPAGEVWIGNSIGVGRVNGVIADRASTDRRAAACPPPRSRASWAVRTAVPVGGDAGGDRSDAPVRAGGTAAHAKGPRVVAGDGAVLRERSG